MRVRVGAFVSVRTAAFVGIYSRTLALHSCGMMSVRVRVRVTVRVRVRVRFRVSLRVRVRVRMRAGRD